MQIRPRSIADKLIRLHQLDMAAHSVTLLTSGLSDPDAAKRLLRVERAGLAAEIDRMLAALPRADRGGAGV